MWTVYRDTLRQLQAQLRELRRRELDAYRDLVITPTPHQQQPLANPVFTVGTPPSTNGIPVPPAAQTPPLPLHNTTNASAPLGAVPGPGVVTLPPAAAPIAIPAVGAPAVPHSTAAPLLPTGTTGTPGTTHNEHTIPLFTVAELHARADVFRRTYRGSGLPRCRVNLSLRISSLQGAGALAYIRRASELIDQLNIDGVGMALDLVLQETEDDIALGTFIFSSFSLWLFLLILDV